jgi:hypothetical protein
VIVEVLAAVIYKITAIWVMVPYSLIDTDAIYIYIYIYLFSLVNINALAFKTYIGLYISISFCIFSFVFRLG